MSALAPSKRGWDPQVALQEMLPVLPTMHRALTPLWDSGVMLSSVSAASAPRDPRAAGNALLPAVTQC